MPDSEGQEAALEVEVNRAVCRGAGECVFRAPGTFALDDESRSRVRDPAGDARDVVLAAARSCPHFAISVTSGGRRLV